MKIDRALNLVVPIERDDGGTIYVHSTPISFEVFERFYLPLSKAYAALHGEHLHAISGPRVAAMLLKTVAQATGRGAGATWWDGPDGIEGGLLPEIRRLSNILTPAQGGGYKAAPLQDALNRKFLDSEEVSEVENQLVFFTLCSVVPPRGDRAALVKGGAFVYNSLTTSLNCTAYAASLPISTPAETTGEMATAS